MQPYRPIDAARRRRRMGVLGLGAVSAFAVLALVAGGGSHKRSPAAVPTGTSPPSTTGAPPTTVAAVSVTVTTVAPTTTRAAPTTTTTVDPGALPQTQVLPSGTDPAFLARIDDLWQAIVSGNAAVAQPAFFPLSAYVQVKAIHDPVHDYQSRLITDYDEDIATLHAEIPGSAVLVGVSVPTSSAGWIVPGVEYNKGGYYRVYSTAVRYSLVGVDHTFYIASMISWRGEWYVVHLSSIR